MITFSIITVAMIALAIALIAPALLRREHTNEGRGYRDGQNVTIAREHLADLDEELANETLSQALYDQSRLEIEQTLLFDLEEQGAAPPPTTRTRSGQGALLVITIAVPLITLLLYLKLGTSALIEPMSTAQGVQGEPSIQQMIGDLQKRLDQNPDDVDGWYLMGRTMMVMKEYAAAAEAYEQAYRLVGDEPMVMLALADASAMAQGGDMSGRPTQLVFNAIAIDPANTTGLWMAGMIAEKQGKLQDALDLWLRLRPLISDMPDEVVQLDQFIKRVATVLKKDVSNLLHDQTSSETATGDSADTAAIQLTVKLADAFYTQVDGEEAVFIYAQALEGPPAPVAAARIQVKDLPISITLDDSYAVMTTSKISDHKEVRVSARVSYSGDAITKSGDLIGKVGRVMVGQSPVTVTINEVSP